MQWEKLAGSTYQFVEFPDIGHMLMAQTERGVEIMTNIVTPTILPFLKSK
jgi:hypothetical protein